MASKTVAQAEYVHPSNLGLRFKQQDQDMLDQAMLEGCQGTLRQPVPPRGRILLGLHES